jgi:hypothetical protein
MKLQVGNMVTIENYRTGNPYKKYFGILTDITNEESGESLSEVADKDRQIIFCLCKIDWITPPLYCNETSQVNATFIREFNV